MFLMIITRVAVVDAATKEDAILQLDQLDTEDLEQSYEVYTLGER